MKSFIKKDPTGVIDFSKRSDTPTYDMMKKRFSDFLPIFKNEAEARAIGDILRQVSASDWLGYMGTLQKTIELHDQLTPSFFDTFVQTLETSSTNRNFISRLLMERFITLYVKKPISA